MRRTMWTVGALVAVVAGVAIGIGAYHAGEVHGLVEAGHASQVVRVVGPRFGFFPFGFFLFPLFLFLVLGLVRGAFWRRRWYEAGGRGSGGPRTWGEGAHDAFADWHRRQHGPEGSEHPAGGGPGAVG